MLEPKSHSLTSERFLINQGSILTHKNGIFIDWVWQPLWRDLRDYWVNMWYKSACLRRFFFFGSLILCVPGEWTEDKEALAQNFSVYSSASRKLKLSQIFLENTLGLVLSAQSWLCNFVETRPFCLYRKSFYRDVFVCFLFLWEQTMKPIISAMKSFPVC